MNKILLTICFLCFIWVYLLFPLKAYAITNPLETENNRFGIHIIDENDIDLAAELVNSTDGQWGYVVIVIREDDRNLEKWQSTFDKLREHKIIPIVRLATRSENGMWAKPREEDVDSWIDFLSSLNWVIKNRYVVLFNEPNHALEWGGEVRPDEYVKFIKLFHQKLKDISNDFFILPAGLDASAPDTQTSQSLESFLSEMAKVDEEIFSYFDGWTSHSYANPGFVSPPWIQGNKSIVSYRTELDVAKSLGLKNDSPVFITETGWIHGLTDDEEINNEKLETIADYYEQAYQEIWTDRQIVAITPFVLRYLEKPFDQFSFIQSDGITPFPQFNRVKNLPKVKGKPIQINKGYIDLSQIPDRLIIGSTYEFSLTLNNRGQSIWDSENTSINVRSNLEQSPEFSTDIITIKPYQQQNFELTIKTPEEIKNIDLTVQLKINEEIIDEKTRSIELNLPPSLFIRAKTWIKSLSRSDDYQLLIYNEGNLLKKFDQFQMINGEGEIEKLYDVIPNQQYRFVLTKPKYLPRQKYEFVNEDKTTVVFDRLIPIDYDGNGEFTDADVVEALRNPLGTLELLSPFTP